MHERTALVGFAEAADMLFEPSKGLCAGIGPIRRLDASIWSMFVCFGEFFLG